MYNNKNFRQIWFTFVKKNFVVLKMKKVAQFSWKGKSILKSLVLWSFKQ